MQADNYLLLCRRYIELNPVRALMVDDPAHYRWSSYRANGLGQADASPTPYEAYSGLGSSDAERLENYRGLFRSELEAEAIGDIRMALDQRRPLGDSRFADCIERAMGQRREVRPRGRRRTRKSKAAGSLEQLPLDM